jgi:APA family basic amino acid/polyamine antiporter
MTVLEQLAKLSSAEDYFRFLGVPYDPAVLNVARLHILRRMGDNLREAGVEPDEEKARAFFRAHLERAYQDFVKSTPIKERVFKVHKDRRMLMADQKAPQMQATLGLTGLTSNAMALIAPGAFLWLTFFIQATTGTTAPAMWIGIFAALLLCLATAVAYAEISKLYPGTGSSYYYAEQALLSKDKAFKYARVAKFIVGWGSHLYYWVYPGVMVATTGVFVGYVVGFLYPNVMSGSNPGPLFMALVAVVFSIFVGWIASKGAGASTAVNLAINVIQISALLVFSVLAIGYRASHPAGRRPSSTTDRRWPPTTTSSPPPRTAPPARRQRRPLPLLDSAGKPVPFTIDYPEKDSTGAFLTHPNAASVIAPHKFSFLFIQATVAILILVGFESVTSMGGEAKNPTKHIPIAVIASLLIQGLVCYLIEYFAANYFLNSGYTMASAASSAAPIGDMMIIVGDALLGHGNGKYFMLAEAFTVFLALIGTTLSCMNTGARVTYAMGKDDEAPEHFGMLHAESLSPRKRHLDAGRHLRGHRRHRRLAGLRRCRRAHRCSHRRRCRTASSPASAISRTTSWPRCPTRC